MFIHSAILDHTQWAPQVKALSDDYTTIAYDVTLSPEDYGVEIERFGSIADRKARDEDLAVGLKQMCNDRCQICGTRRAKPDGTGYSEVHHLQPIREGDGADRLEYMIVLCPNHHADFDNGAASVTSTQ